MEALEYTPKTLSELLGSVAFILHIAGYAVYTAEVLRAEIRPNVATWFMWLFGSAVEVLTYNAIPGGHWATSALPFGCFLGILAACVATVIKRVRSGSGSVHTPERSDWVWLSFDVMAAVYWLGGGSSALANAFAVSTSVFSFIPIWRTTFNDPTSEKPLAWLLWSLAYAAMLLAVITGDGANEVGLYTYPVCYLIFHVIVLWLSLRHHTDAH
jgi:hypothetical protein